MKIIENIKIVHYNVITGIFMLSFFSICNKEFKGKKSIFIEIPKCDGKIFVLTTMCSDQMNNVFCDRVKQSLFGANIRFNVSHFPLNNHHITFACNHILIA